MSKLVIQDIFRVFSSCFRNRDKTLWLEGLRNSNCQYIPNLFDYELSICFFVYENSKKSGKSGKYRVRIKNPDPDSGKFLTSLFSKIKF